MTSRVFNLHGMAMLALALVAASAEPKQGYVGMQIADDPATGQVFIQMVLADSPAEKAGLKAGDIILKVANVEAKDRNIVIKTVTSFGPGDKINVEIRRDGKDETIKVELIERPSDID